MKLQHKAAGLMILVGVISLFLMTIVFTNLIKKTVLQEELQNISNLSEEIAHHMNSHLKSNSNITKTFSSTPIIKDVLIQSNSVYGLLSEDERNTKIDLLNKQWMDTIDINDPFIQNHLTNPAAEFLKLQQTILPGLYGEIFLTNKYGVMIASTGKLTTLAHVNKYWWEASSDDGRGRVFLDDRGFDESVKGYVLGVVVPIKKGDEIIGILKSNINIEGPLTDVIHDFRLNHPGNIQIVRTKGLILAEEGVTPLSNSLSDNITQHLLSQDEGTEIIQINESKKLVAFSPIHITMGSDEFGFGGKYESIDHINGNEGEGWHIVITLDEKIALLDANLTAKIIILAGIIFIILASFIALSLGKWFAMPLINLSSIAKKIGDGHLETRIKVITKDEIGNLAESINKMAENLSKTLISRDNLSHEIKLKEKAENIVKDNLLEKETLLQELYHRTKNNMQVIHSMMLLSSKKYSDDKVNELVKETGSRIQAMAIVHKKLYQSKDLSYINVEEYLEELGNLLIQTYNTSHGKVSLVLDIEDIAILIDTAIPLGLVLNELMSNTLKYAFPNGEKGEVKIKLLQKDSGGFDFIFSDNGIGVSHTFDFKQQQTLGFKMILGIAEQQMGGKVNFKNTEGLTCHIDFAETAYQARV